jgi:hypothetical protein
MVELATDKYWVTAMPIIKGTFNNTRAADHSGEAKFLTISRKENIHHEKGSNKRFGADRQGGNEDHSG